MNRVFKKAVSVVGALAVACLMALPMAAFGADTTTSSSSSDTTSSSSSSTTADVDNVVITKTVIANDYVTLTG